MKKFFWYSAMCLGLLPALTGRAQPQPQTPASDSPSVFETTAGRIRVVRIASGLVSAYSMVFLPEGDLLVVERPGRLRIIRKGILEPQPVWRLPRTAGRKRRRRGGSPPLSCAPSTVCTK